MRAAIYISGILGLVFFTIACIGYLIDLSNYNLYFILSFSLFFLAAFPLYLIEHFQYNKRKDDILKRYKNKKDIKKEALRDKKTDTPYPTFRNKKSGLTWGGGNIHGSTAKRGAKKGFMKH
ncbi:hypothetical protein [Lutimonas sp.]|uniref:hypothetical protein n=1 Tax=Lutimonas sp. TaxID=1872403 RepID=UPI003D9B09E4